MKVTLFTPYPVNTFGGFEKITKVVSDYLSLKGVNFSICKLASEDEIIPPKDEWVEPYNKICNSVLIYKCEKGMFQKLRQWNGDFRITDDKNSLILRNTDIAIIISPVFLKAVSQYLQRIKSKAKIVTWFHLPLSYTFFSLTFPKNLVKSLVFKIFQVYKEQLKYADLHLSISSGIAREIKMFSSNANVKVVYNPVLCDDYLNFEPIKRSEKPIFAYIGRLDNFQKDLLFLLKALSKLKFEWKLKIVGTGPDEEKLKIYAKSIGVEKYVEWLGFSKLPFELLRNGGISAVLLTSKFEGLPTVLIEAISYGIPVVSANCPTGPDDIIINGINGFLYKPGSINDFVDKVNYVVSNIHIFSRPEKIRKTVEKFCTSPVCEAIYRELSNLI